MHIVTNHLRPTVAGALDQAISELPSRTKVTPHLTRLSTPTDLTDSLPRAQVVVVDLDSTNVRSVTGLMRVGLRNHPHIRTFVVPVALTAADDQLALFQLGQLGVQHMPSVQHAETSGYWLTRLHECADANALFIWRSQMQQLFGTDERGAFILTVGGECGAPTVKELAERLYRDDYLSNDGKRRRLWKECDRLQLPHPELLWAGCRLLLLKCLLDHGGWSLQRISFYLGYDDTRKLSAMCKRRYAMTPTQLKERSRLDIEAHVVKLFNERAA